MPCKTFSKHAASILVFFVHKWDYYIRTVLRLIFSPRVMFQQLCPIMRIDVTHLLTLRSMWHLLVWAHHDLRNPRHLGYFQFFHTYESVSITQIPRSRIAGQEIVYLKI